MDGWLILLLSRRRQLHEILTSIPAYLFATLLIARMHKLIEKPGMNESTIIKYNNF
ncbi:hypothetical protein FPSE_10822 [Fusarium pseudograminearum CS3096]|uniref:Uncharacterized protein n=1 Tax=Fusarium pseudograminearum (strain CS3096) TaxID=1028729 RepID=K3V769_FUSPC|nr:hypothetical protein FPSE_10822 [Fusarium pseudograminearum CS3096]EKJ69009.1 hypothetical protein FPSE_10822 [Fusarium pseudograminearum CS3096]